MRSLAAIGTASIVAFALLRCATYEGTARSVDAHAIEAEAGWLRVPDVPVVRQRHANDCGPAALSSVLAFWGQDEPRDEIDERLERLDAGRPGTLAGALRDHARAHGLSAFVFEGTLADLRHELLAGRPVIVGLHQQLSSERVLRHYAVVVGLHRGSHRVLTMDPAHGLREDSLEGFIGEWRGSNQLMLVVFPPASPVAAGRSGHSSFRG